MFKEHNIDRDINIFINVEPQANINLNKIERIYTYLPFNTIVYVRTQNWKIVSHATTTMMMICPEGARLIIIKMKLVL